MIGAFRSMFGSAHEMSELEHRTISGDAPQLRTGFEAEDISPLASPHAAIPLEGTENRLHARSSMSSCSSTSSENNSAENPWYPMEVHLPTYDEVMKEKRPGQRRSRKRGSRVVATEAGLQGSKIYILR